MFGNVMTYSKVIELDEFEIEGNLHHVMVEIQYNNPDNGVIDRDWRYLSIDFDKVPPNFTLGTDLDDIVSEYVHEYDLG